MRTDIAKLFASGWHITGHPVCHKFIVQSEWLRCDCAAEHVQRNLQGMLIEGHTLEVLLKGSRNAHTIITRDFSCQPHEGFKGQSKAAAVRRSRVESVHLCGVGKPDASACIEKQPAS